MSKEQIQLVFKISICFIFIGRAWQHLFWDAPYRSFFWDESLLKPIIEDLLKGNWQTYATSPTTDHFIQSMIISNGVIYLIAAIAALKVNKNNYHWFRFPIYIGSISLVLLAMLLTKEKFYHAAQFFEHSIQFGIPFVFLYTFKQDVSIDRLILILKILIAFTFFSHGLYAFGFYPVPGKFIDMTIHIFGFSESTTITFLYVAGILDFIVAVVLFIPKIQKYAVWYAVIWGLLTAMARIAANFYIDFPLQSIHQNLYQVLYRLPHGLIPLLVIALTKKKQYRFSKIIY